MLPSAHYLFENKSETNSYWCYINIPTQFWGLKKYLNVFQQQYNYKIVKLRQGSGKEGQGMALKAKGLKA